METEFAAFVAIDWADQKHAWMLQVQGSSDREAGTIDHTPEAVDVWAAELRLRFGGQPVAVTLEQSRGPLVFMLDKIRAPGHLSSSSDDAGKLPQKFPAVWREG